MTYIPLIFIFLPSPLDILGDRIILGCTVHLSSQIMLPRYLTRILNSYDKTDRKYSLALLMTLLHSGGQRSRSQSHLGSIVWFWRRLRRHTGSL